MALLVMLIPAKQSKTDIASLTRVIDTGKKFLTRVNDTGNIYFADVADTGKPPK
jgi:hypothetical protein